MDNEEKYLNDLAEKTERNVDLMLYNIATTGVRLGLIYMFTDQKYVSSQRCEGLEY